MRSKSTKTLLNRTGAIFLARAQRSFMRRDAAAAEALGERLGMIAYRLDGKHRERAQQNLMLAFPEWSDAERRRVTVEMFRHFGRMAGDFLRGPIRSDREVLENAEVEGGEYIEEARKRGKGSLAVTGHIGNWERYAHWLRASGNELSVVVRDADSSQINELILKTRQANGIGILSRGNSARDILTKLRRNEMVGILPDQNSEEAFIPFFGKPAGTVLGPAVLHRRTGAALLPMCFVRIAPGKYRVTIRPPIEASDHGHDDIAVMTAVNAELESMIRDHPEQWLWMHDRWKSARRKGLL
jgi:Kdo2-lipid IVA lauroyltransferase/acyltransferase